ncbi:radical SAM protein [Vibrio ouci]|uniref:Radical SAM protein n=1 Tax=Vibrio ouci TaxID=2499078 RepID=A0A4Y8WEC5_9VIBR|nr:radical SAM protein [Vibrio ouci]TFH90996.1 radical SAM protein [Vibrio ouci]
MFKTEISPETLTILTTYQCTAACKDCCFECTPQVSVKLTEEQIKDAILQAKLNFPLLKQVVFSGGECFMLKDTLFRSIALATSLGLVTRCVTNAYWAKNRSRANEIVRELSNSGLTEVNISTGLDHQRWVSLNTVVNALEVLVSHSISTLITIESDTETSTCLSDLTQNQRVQTIRKEHSEKFTLQVNAWMPFHKDSVTRQVIDIKEIEGGCDQLFNNCVITANGEIAACCGLTLEHIDEIKVGKINNLSDFIINQEDDFLKLWIYTDGPIGIIKTLMGFDYFKEHNVHHQCQACVMLHKDEAIKKQLSSTWKEHLIPTIQKFNLKKNGISVKKMEYV